MLLLSFTWLSSSLWGYQGIFFYTTTKAVLRFGKPLSPSKGPGSIKTLLSTAFLHQLTTERVKDAM